MTLDTVSEDLQVIGYILLNRLDVKKANSLSGHLAYGFPSITAFKGFAHALTRALRQSSNPSLNDLAFRGVMVACHDYEVYGTKDAYGYTRFSQYSFSANTMGQVSALVRSKRLPSITEQCYVDITTSLVLEVIASKELSDKQKADLEYFIFDFTRKNRIAGGVVQPNFLKTDVEFIKYDDLEGVAYKISDSYILTDAQELMRQYLEENPDDNALDAVLKLSSRQFKPTSDDKGNIYMQYQPLDEKYKAVAVMSVGYQGITPAIDSSEFTGSLSQKEQSMKTQYVESVYSLVKWELPHVLRLNGFLKDSFWMYENEAEELSSIYLVSQPKLSEMYSNNNGV